MQVVLLDDPVGPYAAHQIALVDDGAARVDERQEGVERPPSRTGWAIGQQLPALRDEREPAEFIWLLTLWAPHHDAGLYRPVGGLLRMRLWRSPRRATIS